MKRILTFSLLFLGFQAGSSWGADASQDETSLSGFVRHVLERSPDLNVARLEVREAELAEPLFLSELDTQIDSGYQKTIDDSPRAAPAFEGTKSAIESFNVDLAQKTLLGTEARLSWNNHRLDNGALFRELNPSADSILSLGIKQNLVRYLWGRPDISRRKRYRAQTLAVRERTRQQAEELAASAIRAALDLHFSQERVRVAEQNVATAKVLVQANERKKKFGMVEESEQLQASASLEAEETELLMSRSSVQIAQHTLTEYTGPGYEMKLSSFSILSTNLAQPGPTLEQAIEQASRSRGDLLALEAAAEAAEWAARSEVLETLPEVSLNASYGVAGLDSTYAGAWNDLNGFDHVVKSIGFNVLTPIGYRKEKLLRKQKKLDLDISRQTLQRRKERMEREVRDAWENYHLNQTRIKARARLVELHQKKYEAEKENFKRGRSNTDLLVRFLQEAHQAELLFIRAQTDLQFSEIDLARSTGTLLPSLRIEELP